jgi:hypothetical protein
MKTLAALAILAATSAGAGSIGPPGTYDPPVGFSGPPLSSGFGGHRSDNVQLGRCLGGIESAAFGVAIGAGWNPCGSAEEPEPTPIVEIITPPSPIVPPRTPEPPPTPITPPPGVVAPPEPTTPVTPPVVQPAPVPLPAGLWMLLVGLASFATFGRLHRRT